MNKSDRSVVADRSIIMDRSVVVNQACNNYLAKVMIRN